MRLQSCGSCGLSGILANPQMRMNSIHVSKGQRMSEVVLDNHGSSDSRWRCSRVGLLLFTAVAVALLCKPLPAQNAGGTASGSGSSGQASAAGSSGQATAQGDGAQASSAQGGNAQATAQSETSVYDSGGNALATDQTQMSAEQIIAIMQQQPGLRSTIKAMVAQQTGVAPSTISDEALYNNIRQDANLRAQVTTNLNQLGYAQTQLRRAMPQKLRAQPRRAGP